MSYNVSYTSLPIFTPNSIGFCKAIGYNQTGSFELVSGFGINVQLDLLTVNNVAPGIYIFNCSFYIPVNQVSSVNASITNIFSEICNTTQNINYCTAYSPTSINSSVPTYPGTINCSQVLPVGQLSTIVLNLFYSYSLIGSNESINYTLSYSLTRIA